MIVGGIFRDLAFDCVNNYILLIRLHFYGSQAKAEKWFRFNLIDRKED